MFEVKIFVDTSIKGPCIKDAEYDAIVEYTKRDGQKVVREVKGAEKSTTFNKMAFVGVLESLDLLNAKCLVTIYTDCKFIINMTKNGTPEKWNRNEWKTSRGADVKNKGMWQQLMEKMEIHEIRFVYGKTREYIERIKKQ